MRLNRAATVVHKWLALLMAAQILLWFVSGLFFAVVPIERVRSEHLLAEVSPRPVVVAAAASGLGALAGQGVAPADRIDLLSILGRPAAIVSRGDSRPLLYDLETGRQLSPLAPDTARRIAVAAYSGAGTAGKSERVSTPSPEYRGRLPAWRIDFAGNDAVSFYVAADTGAVVARRSTLWRVYDFLWSLHIMDYRGHEDFNTPLLAAATMLGLAVVITGVIMLPSRLRRRKRAAR